MGYRRGKKRRSSRRKRSPRRNPPLTRKKKLMLGALGGTVVVGGIVAFALTASAQDSGGNGAGGGPVLDPRAAKAAECAALQTRMEGLRAQPAPDPGALSRLEAEIAACLEELVALGGEPPPADVQLSAGDTKYARIELWFTEYRATDYSDALKRNNIRQEMLRAGAEMAAAYAGAVVASPDDAMTVSIRLSIIRALDAALKRRVCYLYDQRGCGRFGVNEDHGNDKAAQVQTRVVDPLLAAQTAAAAKLGGPGRMRNNTGNRSLIAALLAPLAAAKAYTDAKFAEYKRVDYSDALRRNNLRQEVLRSGRETVTTARRALTAVRAFRNSSGLLAPLVLSALDAAETRWLCYLLGQPGCGRFALNEDPGNTKADQEHSAVIAPLNDICFQSAAALIYDRVSFTPFEPLIAIKLRVATVLNDFVNTKFAEYKRVDYTDAIRRNNLRQVVLLFGRHLAARLATAEDFAERGPRYGVGPPLVIAGPAMTTAGREAAAAALRERTITARSGRTARSGAPRLLMSAEESRARLREMMGK